MSVDQVEGVTRVMDYWEATDLTDLRWLAYMYATVYHETARTMQPIKEYGGERYLKKKPYYPYYGRGLVQITWEDNYEEMGDLLHTDFVSKPDVVLTWEHALPIMFEGMTRGLSKRGDFTGKSLEHYFNDKIDDPVGARRIINGTDKAHTIAKYHYQFLDALKASYKED
jgi:hypothetical protein